MTGLRMLLASGAALTILSAQIVHVSPLRAQEIQAPTDGEMPTSPAVGEDPCEVQPDADDQAGVAEPEVASEEATSLTETLDRCGGVLQPPSVGDTELVEPAPDKGVTPIIPPSAVPEEQPPAAGD